LLEIVVGKDSESFLYNFHTCNWALAPPVIDVIFFLDNEKFINPALAFYSHMALTSIKVMTKVHLMKKY
jgi:hypothetical protein